MGPAEEGQNPGEEMTALGYAVVWIAALSLPAAAKGASVLKHSDVVAMYSASPETCRDFSISIIGWGGRPRDEADTARFEEQTIEPLHRIGVQYTGSVGMVTEFGQFMDSCPDWEQAICLDVNGKRLQVPWLWDHSHQGNPAYWFCTNDPRYRKYLRDQVVLAARGGMDGVHIDDHLGASATGWLGGCFCDDCVAGFRTYLREHVPAARREEAGVGDPETFNYCNFARQWLEAHPGRKMWDVPLWDEYRTYEYRAAEDFMGELRALAEKTAGRPLTFSANAGLPDVGQMTDYRVLTQFTAEVGQAAERGLDEENVNAVVAYKVAAALGRPLTATASGQDWAFIKANERPELVRAWIANAYAFGQYLMTPHHQWCYTEQLGTHWYDGPAEEYGPTYRFIREHPSLFDGEESAAQVAVLFSAGAARRGEDVTAEVARYLLEAQVPFDVVVAGDEWVPARLTWAQVRRYGKVIAGADLHLDAGQQHVVDRLRREGRLVIWNGPEAGAALPASWVSATAATPVWAVLRREAGGQRAVCHLLNRDYDAAADRVRPAGPFTVTIAETAIGSKLSKAVLYAPGAEPRPLRASRSERGLTIEVPSLGLWGVVLLGP
jgi:hypothetical protein